MKVSEIMEATYPHPSPTTDQSVSHMSSRQRKDLGMTRIYGKWWSLSIPELRDQLMKYRHSSDANSERTAAKLKKIIAKKEERKKELSYTTYPIAYHHISSWYGGGHY